MGSTGSGHWLGRELKRIPKETEAAGITKITKVTTPENGSFTIIGLDADTYYLTETKQPDGYNKLSNPVKIVIAADGKITIGDKTVDHSGDATGGKTRQRRVRFLPEKKHDIPGMYSAV